MDRAKLPPPSPGSPHSHTAAAASCKNGNFFTSFIKGVCFEKGHTMNLQSYNAPLQNSVTYKGLEVSKLTNRLNQKEFVTKMRYSSKQTLLVQTTKAICAKALPVLEALKR